MADAKLEVLLSAKDISAAGFASFKRQLAATVRSFASFQGMLAGAGVVGFSKVLFNAGKDIAALERAFIEITGSTGKMREQFEFVRSASDKMGQNFYALIPAYKNLLAASKGTSLEGQKIRDIFIGITKAGASLVLSSDQVKGALRAIEQMISKGNVQAEELRGQLGERLPGAFNLSAEAMGVTTQELNKMLDNGQVLAADLLPKLATLLKSRYSGEVSNATRASNNMSEAWQDMKVSMSKSGFLDDVSESLVDISKTMKDPEFLAAMKDLGSVLGDIIKMSASLATAAAKLVAFPKTFGDKILIAGGQAPTESIFDVFDRLTGEENIIQRQIAAAQKRAQTFHQDAFGWRGKTFGREIYLKQYQEEIDKINALQAKLKELQATRYSGAVPADLYGDNSYLSPTKTTPGGVGEQYGQELKEFHNWYKEFADATNEKSRAFLEMLSGVDDALADFFDSLDADIKPVAIDLDLNEFFGDLDSMEKGLSAHYKEMHQLTQHTAEAMQDAFSDFFFDALMAKFKSFSDYINGFLRSVARAMSSYFAQGFTTSALGSLGLDFGGFRASGGPVYPGQTYIVGENGPEVLSMGRSSGYVTPNNATGAGNVNVQVVLHNEGGQQMQVKRQQTYFDGARAVAELWIEAYEGNVAGLREYAG